MLNPAIRQAVSDRIQDILPVVIDFRHRLHRRPEIALHEVWTQAAVRAILADTRLAFWEPLLGTDVIGELAGKAARTVVLRADMDALPIEEQVDVTYRSEQPGMMHACGHDGHVAMLAGAALVLDRLREYLPVGVRFVFQPGEEIVAAGKTLVERGACRGAEAAFALHGRPGYAAGVFNSRPGVLYAAGGEYIITIHGHGGHSSMPELCKNPIPVAARVIEELLRPEGAVQQVEDCVFAVSVVHAGASSNVIPDQAVIRGTMRYLTPEAGTAVEAAARETCARIAQESCLSITVEWKVSYGLPVVNSTAGYQYARQTVTRYIGEDNWQELPKPSYAMEDFAYYLRDRDGCMSWLGLGEGYAPLHSPFFDFNDAVLGTGIEYFCLLALGYE